MQHCQSRKVWAVKDKLDQATAVLRRERLQNKQELEKHKSLATIAVGETAIGVPLSLSPSRLKHLLKVEGCAAE